VVETAAAFSAEWPPIDALIAERDPYCRGVVLLGLSAPIETLARGFADASPSKTCRGFAVGRTIFHEPARAWLAGATDDAGLVTGVRANFEALIEAWTDARSAR
jgi:5-dehydro-2-deoxygluconokinase